MKCTKSPFRNAVVVTVLLAALALSASMPATTAAPRFASSSDCVGHAGEPYVLAGGLNGTWFRTTQFAKLSQIYLPSRTVTKLTVTTQPSDLWSGGWNGSQWLISGAGGQISGTNASDPFIYLYDGCEHLVGGTQYLWGPQGSWHGGDVFASSYNGSHWLLSGLGSDVLPNQNRRTNHMALGTFDGYTFQDLSGDVPNQRDFILYTNGWNGHCWLIGGGYARNGVLYTYDGRNLTVLSQPLKAAVPTAQSVQRIVWNGRYWLVGGIGFLARYDGKSFTDLTQELNGALDPQHTLGRTCCNAVSALAWNGATWLIGGGAPIAVLGRSSAWLVAYDGSKFTSLPSVLPTYISNPSRNSSILAIAYVASSWILGGYANGRGILLSYAGGAATDMSYLANDMSTVNFVGAGTQRSTNIPEFLSPALITVGSIIVALVVLQRKSASALQ